MSWNSNKTDKYVRAEDANAVQKNVEENDRSLEQEYMDDDYDTYPSTEEIKTSLLLELLSALRIKGANEELDNYIWW